MTGLDKIIKQIQDDSEANVNNIISAAQAKADEITEAAKNKAEGEAKEIIEKATKDAEIILSRVESTNNIDVKNSVLLRKQALIKSAVESAEKALYELPESEYFDLILKIVSKYAPKKSGTVKFNKKDLARLPEDFKTKMTAALNSSDAVLEISDEAADIDGGFILCYGGIEENCSIKALFESAADELSDKAHTLLFS